VNLSRLLYFIYYGAVGSNLPFFPLFLTEKGFTHNQVGFLTAIQGLSVLIAPIFSSHIADTKKNGAKNSLILCSFLSALMLFIISFVSDFYLIALLLLIFGLFYVPLFSLIDGFIISLDSSSKKSSVDNFSANRAYGTVGFIIPALILYPLFSIFTLKYVTAIYLSCAYFLVTIIILLTLNFKFNQSKETIVGKLPIIDGVKAIFSRNLFYFSATNFLIAISMGTYYAFFSLKLQSIGIEPKNIGLIYNLGPFFEFFILINGSKLIEKFGLKSLILFCALAATFRFFILWQSDSIGWIVFSMLFHGLIIFSLGVINNIVTARYCEKNIRFSILGVMQILNGGIARLIGGVLGASAFKVGFFCAVTAIFLSFFIRFPKIDHSTD
jgi:PPP family 3-phenylpropionic acid transporter